VLASKVWYELDKKGAIDSVHQSLKRLADGSHRHHADPWPHVFAARGLEHILKGGPARRCCSSCAKQGKIGHIGITTEEALDRDPVPGEQGTSRFYQIAYNIIYQAAGTAFFPDRGGQGQRRRGCRCAR